MLFITELNMLSWRFHEKFLKTDLIIYLVSSWAMSRHGGG